MTFCLGIKVESGLVAIADTRLTSGAEYSTGKKVSVHQFGKHSLFIMTSGLRSVRDKAITYFNEVIKEQDRKFNRLYKAVNAFGEQVKRVAGEDKDSLYQSGLYFNLHAIVGGQLEDDDEHKLFLLYPEGNWVEVGPGTPFVIIGNTNYGKPLLHRQLRYETSMRDAMMVGFLAFDATKVSVNDVDYPLDIILYEKGSFQIKDCRLEREELKETSKTWSELLKHAIGQLPDQWVDKVFDVCELPKEE
ncbi:peptidase [Cytophagaceae bacterium DM2B3-1]|uniref:Peptidase n=1 Tax=Xanthocytophaga flava TaxID=3048013 RepID=A0ABT7CVL8_9BACT|nr:peptidase [Xanthocytophaga flavus]MDJ1497792.1 peptidase [Xanthocytophaga flavus]